MKGLLLLLAGGAGVLFFGVALFMILAAWKKFEENMRSQGTKMSRPVALLLCLFLIAGSAAALYSGYTEYKAPPLAVVTKEPVKSLGFTVAEFKDRFNQAAKRVGVKLRVDKIAMDPVTEGDAREIFRVPFGDAVAILGGADLNTHALTEFLVLFVWSENEKMHEENLLKLLACSTVLIEMCNPGLTGEQRVGILHEVGLFGEKGDMAKRRLVRGDIYKTSTQSGSVKYTFREALGEKAILTIQSL